MDKKVGEYAFIVGVIIALVLGLLGGLEALQPADPWLVSILVILGLVVGFLNVTGKETMQFLTVSAILAIVLYVGGTATGQAIWSIERIGPYINDIIKYIMVFIVPAVVVVSLKEIVDMAKSK